MSYMAKCEHNETTVSIKSSGEAIKPNAMAMASNTSTMTDKHTVSEYTEDLLAQFKAASMQGSTKPLDSFKATPSTGAFDDAFNELVEPPSISLVETWNGDINYAELSADQRDVASAILAFTQKLVMPEKTPVKGRGSKRRGQDALPLDPVDNLPVSFQHQITTGLTSIISKIKKMSDKEQAIYTALLFVTMFRERAIVSGSRSSIGKGHRSISYLIFRTLHKEMPRTAIACIPYFVHFGYWGDLNAICAHYIKDGNDKRVVSKCIDMMLDSLDKSVRSLPGAKNRGFLKKNGEVMTHSDFRKGLDGHRLKIQSLSDEAIEKHYSCVHNDNCAKFIPSEGKRHEHLRPLLIAGMLWDGDMTRTLGAVKFGQATLTRLTTILRRLGNVVETRMSANDWTFDIKKVSAGALHKHRKAFLNEDLDEELSMCQTDGNRTADADRIALRKSYLEAAIKCAIKGAGLDSVKFARTLKNCSSMSRSEAIVIHAQFMALVEDLRKQLQKEYDDSIASWQEEGADPTTKPLNPFNVIATIDVSGSMGCVNVLEPAIVLGIITTLLSNLGNVFLTFSYTPSIIKLDMHEGTTIVDWYQQVKHVEWGGSTNIDAAMQKLIGLFHAVKRTDPSFDGRVNHIIFTDGQFNPSFANFGATGSSYSYYNSTGIDYSDKWNPFAKRMEKLFHENGFALPLTCFWNMSATSPGFPAHSKYQGLTLSEGLSHGMFVNVLGNKVTFKKTESGAVVADTDPITSFLQGMARDDFNPVINTVLSTGEGVFGEASTHPHVRAFLAAYTK